MTTIIKICLILTISALCFTKPRILAGGWPVATYQTSKGQQKCHDATMVEAPNPMADGSPLDAYKIFSHTTLESLEDHNHLINGFAFNGGECKKEVERFRYKGRRVRKVTWKVTRCRGRVHGLNSDGLNFVWEEWLNGKGEYANKSLRFQMVAQGNVACMLVPQNVKDCDTFKVIYNGRSRCASCKNGKKPNRRGTRCY